MEHDHQRRRCAARDCLWPVEMIGAVQTAPGQMHGQRKRGDEHVAVVARRNKHEPERPLKFAGSRSTGPGIGCRVKFYDFVDKSPSIGKLVIVEGTERVLAERALDLVIERVLPPDMRDMNLERFAPSQLDGTGRIREAVQAMPFLASSRLVIVS